MLKYTDITQNTYVQSWTVTEIMAREKCGLLAGPRTVPVSWPYPCPSLSVVPYYGNSAHARSKLFMYILLGDKAVHVSAWNPKDNYDMSASVFVVNLMALCNSQVSLMLSTYINITETTYSCQF